jgi:hypothetical protein
MLPALQNALIEFGHHLLRHGFLHIAQKYPRAFWFGLIALVLIVLALSLGG